MPTARSCRTLIAVALAAGSVGWLDPYASGRSANRLFREGKYDDAASKYNEALVDRPDSAPLHFNLGDAEYKQGKYDDALKAFQQVATPDGDPTVIARVAYNIGNLKYRQAQAAESSDPKTALADYAEALAAYRRAMGAAPNDLDAKFNYEFVEKKLADLKKQLEEQQKQQQQQPNQDQKNDQQQPDQQAQKQEQDKAQSGQPADRNDQKDQNEQNDQKDQKDRQNQQQQAQANQQSAQPQNQAGEPQPAEGSGAADSPDKKDGEMSRQEAIAVLDSQRDQEVQPDEVVKKLHGAVVAEPAQDW